MKLSIAAIVGKPEQFAPNVHFVNYEASWNDVFELITGDGYATCAELKPDTNGIYSRKASNFASRELMMVDIDEGMTLDELAKNEFFQQFAAGFYTTPSHTEAHHKFRIMFRCETPLTNVADVHNFNIGLFKIYPYADAACKDPTRLYYGNPAPTCCGMTNNILPDDVVAIIIAAGAESAIGVEVQYPKFVSTKSLGVLKREMLTHLNVLKAHVPVLRYEDRVVVTRAVFNVFTAVDTIAIMRERWSDSQSTTHYEQMLKTKPSATPATVGSIIWKIWQHDSNYLKGGGEKYKAEYARLRELRSKLRLKRSKAQHVKKKR